jgi:hypothetical protein
MMTKHILMVVTTADKMKDGHETGIWLSEFGEAYVEFRNKGYEAYVMRAEVDSVSLYRAKVGRFRTRDEAEGLLEVLKDKEAYTAAFVSRM